MCATLLLLSSWEQVFNGNGSVFQRLGQQQLPLVKEVEVQNLIQLLKDRGVDYVGFSVRASAFHRMAKFLTERIRTALGFTDSLGRDASTFMPDVCIQVADCIAIGEVDHAVIEFFNRVDSEKMYELHHLSGFAKNPMGKLLFTKMIWHRWCPLTTFPLETFTLRKTSFTSKERK